MIKHTQIIRRLLPTNCFIVFDHFVGLPLKRLAQKISTRLWKPVQNILWSLKKRQIFFIRSFAITGSLDTLT